MAAPNLASVSSVYMYNLVVPMTNTSDTNLIANLASSGKLVLVKVTAANYGSASATITRKRWTAAGTTMLSNAGVTGTAYGSTATGGSSLGAGAAISVPVGGEVVTILDKFPLNEDQSLTFAASASNTICMWLEITVLG